MEDELAELEKELKSYRKKIESEKLPPVLVSRPNYEELRPKSLKRVMPPFDDLEERIRNAREYYEYTKQLEDNKRVLDFYHSIRKLKGTHPRKFNIEEYAELKTGFEKLSQERKEQLEEEIQKLGEIAATHDFHHAILDSTLEQAMRKLDQEPQKRRVKEKREEDIGEEIRKEWLSEGILTKQFMRELQARHPKKDVGREIIDFYVRNKLSQEMLEALPKVRK